jgi:hypothetical protein
LEEKIWENLGKSGKIWTPTVCKSKNGGNPGRQFYDRKKLGKLGKLEEN